MTANPARNTRARKVPCPECKAPISKPCLNENGTSHSRRVAKYQANRVAARKEQVNRKRQKNNKRSNVRETVMCPNCGALPNKRCKGSNGRVRKSNHKERVQYFFATSFGKNATVPAQHAKKVSYLEYIGSSKWQNKRKQRLKLPDAFECWTCGDTKFVGGRHVHHRSYLHLTKEPMKDLVITCADCNMSRIPALVALLKEYEVVPSYFQWIATDFVRLKLRGTFGPEARMTVAIYDKIVAVIPEDRLLESLK